MEARVAPRSGLWLVLAVVLLIRLPLLNQAMQRYQLSARSYERILKVSRTIADLGGEARIGLQHLSEAIAYRQLDKDYLSR